MPVMAFFVVFSACFSMYFINKISDTMRFTDDIPQKQYSVVNKKIEERRGSGRKPEMNKGIGWKSRTAPPL